MVWLSQPTQSPHLLSRFHLAQCGTVHLPGNSDRRKQQNTHDLFAGFALNFIRRHQREPFFLYVPFTAPHDDIEIPDMAPYADQSWTEEEKVYAAMITRMDRDIGTILSLLQELSLDERTIVFFCSDNGAANRYEHLFKNSGLLTGRKRDMTEGGIRTPMVVRWPGKVPAAQVSEQPWTLADFFATATDLADAPSPPANDARGILPTLLGVCRT